MDILELTSLARVVITITISNIIFLMIGLSLGLGIKDIKKQATKVKQQVKDKVKEIQDKKAKSKGNIFQAQDLAIDREQRRQQEHEENKLPH